MVDVGRATNGVNQLRATISQLNSAKSMLIRYKSIFGTCWQGTEICYYINAIDDVMRQIDSLCTTISKLATDYINTANTIRHEEEEAERLAREAAERAAREAAERAAQETAERAAREVAGAAARTAFAALRNRFTI